MLKKEKRSNSRLHFHNINNFLKCKRSNSQANPLIDANLFGGSSRSQITIFIIIAILLVASIGILFFVRNQLNDSSTIDPLKRAGVSDELIFGPYLEYSSSKSPLTGNAVAGEDAVEVYYGGNNNYFPNIILKNEDKFFHVNYFVPGATCQGSSINNYIDCNSIGYSCYSGDISLEAYNSGPVNGAICYKDCSACGCGVYYGHRINSEVFQSIGQICGGQQMMNTFVVSSACGDFYIARPTEGECGVGSEIIDYEDSVFGITAYLSSENQEILSDLGVRWVRPGIIWFDVESTEGNFDFSAKDNYINSMYASNLKAVMTLSSSTPWDQCLCHNKCGCSMPADGGKYGCFYIYCNQENYKNYVKKVVERYDGDSDYGCVVSAPDCYKIGDSQYPSSETIESIQNNPIKYWEILNEPFSEGYWKSWVPGNVTTEYIDILESSNEAIKEVCSDCKVVIGGLYDYIGGGSTSNGMNLDIIKSALDKADNPFDVMNFHSYGNRSNILLSLNYFTQNYPDKELIITETALTSYKNSEKDFAQDLTRRYVLSIGADIRIIMWLPLIESLSSNEGIKYGAAGLVAEDGTKRLDYYSYKLMIDKLEGSNWSNVQEIYNSGNVYAYKFIKKSDGSLVYVVWWDYWNEPTLTTKQVSIPVSFSGNVKVTETVPAYENGLLLQQSGVSYPNFFNKGKANILNGQITITLGQSPVYIEETTESLGDYVPHVWQNSAIPRSTTTLESTTYTCPNEQCEKSLGENSKNCPADCVVNK